MSNSIQPDSRGVGGTIQTAIWTLAPRGMGRRAAQIYETMFSPRRAAINAGVSLEATRAGLAEVDRAVSRLPKPVIDLRDQPSDADVHALDHLDYMPRYR